MSHVALRARFITSDYRGSKNLVTGGGMHDKWIDNWSSLSIDITEQWDTVRRCCVGIHDLMEAAEFSGNKCYVRHSVRLMQTKCRGDNEVEIRNAA